MRNNNNSNNNWLMQFSFVKCITKCFCDGDDDDDDDPSRHVDDDNSTMLHHIAVSCFVHKTSKSICTLNNNAPKRNEEQQKSTIRMNLKSLLLHSQLLWFCFRTVPLPPALCAYTYMCIVQYTFFSLPFRLVCVEVSFSSLPSIL